MSHVLRYKVASGCQNTKATDATLKDVTPKERRRPHLRSKTNVPYELEERTNLLMSACRGKNPIIQENQAENPVTDWNTTVVSDATGADKQAPPDM